MSTTTSLCLSPKVIFWGNGVLLMFDKTCGTCMVFAGNFPGASKLVESESDRGSVCFYLAWGSVWVMSARIWSAVNYWHFQWAWRRELVGSAVFWHICSFSSFGTRRLLDLIKFKAPVRGGFHVALIIISAASLCADKISPRARARPCLKRQEFQNANKKREICFYSLILAGAAFAP